MMANRLAMAKCTHMDRFHLWMVGPSPHLLGLSLLVVQ